MSMPIPLMSGNAPSRNLGILASRGNTVSYVQADGYRSMSSALAGPAPGALVGQRPSASFPNLKKADPPSSSH